jgi:hypothetical protein
MLIFGIEAGRWIEFIILVVVGFWIVSHIIIWIAESAESNNRSKDTVDETNPPEWAENLPSILDIFLFILGFMMFISGGAMFVILSGWYVVFGILFSLTGAWLLWKKFKIIRVPSKRASEEKERIDERSKK